jgi:hypothetical protein
MGINSLGKYYDQVKLGRVFIGSTAAAGTAFPIVTGTAATFGLWNTNPNKVAVLLSLSGGFTSGTIALGTIGLGAVAATVVATGSNITAFTDAALGTTLRNGLVGGGDATTMRFTPSAATIASSVAFPLLWTGPSFHAATTVTPNQQQFHVDFDGKVVVPYGQFVFVAGSVAQTALFSMSLAWAEYDL